MTKIKQNVMYTVYVVYVLRRALSPLALKGYAFVAASVALLSLISVPSILQNLMVAGLSGAGALMVDAIASTSLSVQVTCALATLFGVLLVRDSLISRVRGVFN